MPRPRMFWFSSTTTALVVVEPRSMPMKQRMGPPPQWATMGMNLSAWLPTPDVRFCWIIWK